MLLLLFSKPVQTATGIWFHRKSLGSSCTSQTPAVCQTA